ncbi:AsmA-like C-terminal domain-containing protein [Devosia chinhatensis]|uniref:AsmA-like C-terminal domain-containing protein n=1 Tax=Devosia chinhatensis TaxID=429727 RepID=UPI001364B9F4|nr:AsmA-like C-terminal domain-containing protein [Devosia chinhatensis]
MSEATISTQQPESSPKPPGRSQARRFAKMGVWLLGIPSVVLLLLYLVLLVTPLRMPFSGPAVRSLVQSFLPETAELTMGDLALALEDGVWPVLRFEPVQYLDRKSGARIAMEALEIGFSPARALFGQPGTTITVVAPHVQMIQDLYGPRPANFQLDEGVDGGPTTLRVIEGDDAFPAIAISNEGIDFQSGPHVPMRSDNDWLVYNLEASEAALVDLVDQTAQGRFSRLVVRDGRIDMADPVYGLFRQFSDVALDVGPVPRQERVEGSFSARIGGRTIFGTLERTIDEDGTRRLLADITNLDFSALLPFIDDGESLAAMRGAGAVSINVAFGAGDGKLLGGDFKLDLTGTDLRIGEDLFPVASSILDVDWNPFEGQFTLNEGVLQIGQSSARVSGLFAMGLDERFGPTIAISLSAREVSIHPNDMAAPEAPMDLIEFSGWSAPLYGAVGVDRFLARKDDGLVEARGRFDLLRAGMGVDLTMAGNGLSADDVKRLWPYVMGEESRDWFVANVTDGRVKEGRMTFRFPVGSLGRRGENLPIPPDSMSIEIVGEGVAVKPSATLAPIVIDGETRLRVDDEKLSVAGGGGSLATSSGIVTVTNPALVMDNSDPEQSLVEVSGKLGAPIPALVALVQEQQPEALAALDLPVSLDSLSGSVDMDLVASFGLADNAEQLPKVDYVVNGTVSDFASSQPIEGRRIANGQLAFSASQLGYQLGGTADIDGVAAELSVDGNADTDPNFRVASTIEIAALKDMGFDLSQFATGAVSFMAQPRTDGAIDVSIDLAQAGLTIRDLGITKSRGTAGTLSAVARFDGEITRLEDINLAFGDVRLEGKLDFHATDGLVAADFGTVAISAGDNASVTLAPMEGGYSVRVRGRQLDLKPVLGRFFSLDQGSGGLQNTQLNAAIALDVELDRAVGFYATTAFNLDLNLLLRGTQLSRATLSAQFGEGNAVSITTNPAPNGRSLVMAFNDAGTILRLLGVYSQLAGGSGSLVMTTDRNQDLETGQLILRDFAIVDEANVIQVLGNHSDSRAAIAASNRLDFDAGQVDFIRRSDRVEVTNAVLAGDAVGGSLRGFIYTDRRQYDLTGTYVPLFGLNNAFSQIPILGPLLGGRNGEGLVGVTFAVRGALDRPEFLVNPLSVLAPGFLREFFEFRSREVPGAQ